MSKSGYVVSIFVACVLSACGGDSGNSSDTRNDELSALSCEGNRIWDFGDSDVLLNALSYISETGGVSFESSKFPCAAIWEYSPTINCSLVYSYEQWLEEFEVEDQLQTLGLSGANLISRANDGSQVVGTPAGISVTDLDELPDCEIE